MNRGLLLPRLISGDHHLHIGEELAHWASLGHDQLGRYFCGEGIEKGGLRLEDSEQELVHK